MLINRLLFLTTLLFTISCTSISAETNESAASWTLSPLNQETRATMIQKLIAPQNYTLYRGEAITRDYSSLEEKECPVALNNIKDNRYEILEPAQIIQDIDRSHWLEDNLKNCDPFEGHIDYFPSQADWKNQDNQNSYIFRTANNLEFYDFSEYLGSNFWGIFAEGGKLECKENMNDFCKNLRGFHQIAKVYDGKNCRVSKNYVVPSQRLKPVGDAESYKFEPTNNFFSYIEIEKNIYRLAYKTDISTKDVCMQEEIGCSQQDNSFLYLDKITSTEEDAISCLFRAE